MLSSVGLISNYWLHHTENFCIEEFKVKAKKWDEYVAKGKSRKDNNLKESIYLSVYLFYSLYKKIQWELLVKWNNQNPICQKIDQVIIVYYCTKHDCMFDKIISIL